MLSTVKAEFRKLLTLRSSYGVAIVCLVLVFLFAFYGAGFHSQPGDLKNPHLLAQQASDAISFLGVIGALVAVLLVTNEYRYNLIVYTLTAARSRSRVVVAKLLAVTAYALVFAALFAVLSPLLAAAGLHVHGVRYVHQSIPYASLVWRILFGGWALFMYAFVIAQLIRNQVGALVTAFVFPGIVNQLLTLVFRGNSKYLPYFAVDNVLHGGSLSYGKAALVAVLYIVAAVLVSWWLFLKRDAN